MASSLELKVESRAYISGSYVPSLTQPPSLITVTSPSTGLPVGTVEVASAEDVDAAVLAAKTALKGPWSTFTGTQRAACLSKFADLLEKYGPKIAEVESMSMGAPIAIQAGGMIPQAANFFRYYAGLAFSALKGESFPIDDSEGSYRIVQHQPYGVCALIVAWNSTILFLGTKLGPALATGNTVVFKASEKSPLGALMLAPLFKEAGFPDGVVNIISGTGPTGDLLSHHMQISKISFTGSAAVGRKILAASAASNLKKVTLELGGKSPAIVFKDANLEKTIPMIAQAVIILTGQACVNASRVLVQEEIYDAVVAGVKAFFEGSRAMIGDPMVPTSMIGPIVDEKQFARVMSFIKNGKAEAELAVGGEQVGEKGFFVQPTLFLKPGREARIYREEIFGPVMMINTFKTEEEAIEMANDTEYGLHAAIYTADVAKALRVAGKVEAGTITINRLFHIDLNCPFGGWKGSGLGNEGGEYAMKEYLQEKSIKIGIN